MANILEFHVQIYNFAYSLEQPQHLLTIVPSLIVITPSVSRIDGSIYEKYSANYGVFCPLMDLTKFNRHVNFAYISDYAAPDHRFPPPGIHKQRGVGWPSGIGDNVRTAVGSSPAPPTVRVAM